VARSRQDAFIAIDPANLSAGERDDREMLINSRKGKLQDIETVRYWQKDSSRRWPIAAVSHRRRRQVNRLIGRLLGEAPPTVDLAHLDLARRQQRPERHRGGLHGRQHGLRLDPSLELLMQAFNCIRMKVKSLSPVPRQAPRKAKGAADAQACGAHATR
jgi:hypothetical protein